MKVFKGLSFSQTGSHSVNSAESVSSSTCLASLASASDASDSSEYSWDAWDAASSRTSTTDDTWLTWLFFFSTLSGVRLRWFWCKPLDRPAVSSISLTLKTSVMFAFDTARWRLALLRLDLVEFTLEFREVGLGSPPLWRDSTPWSLSLVEFFGDSPRDEGRFETFTSAPPDCSISAGFCGVAVGLTSVSLPPDSTGPKPSLPMLAIGRMPGNSIFWLDDPLRSSGEGRDEAACFAAGPTANWTLLTGLPWPGTLPRRSLLSTSAMQTSLFPFRSLLSSPWPNLFCLLSWKLCVVRCASRVRCKNIVQALWHRAPGFRQKGSKSHKSYCYILLPNSARPMPGRKFQKNKNNYRKTMACRKVYDGLGLQKQRTVEGAMCINGMSQWLLRCQWNDMKESMHNWLNQWTMNQWINESVNRWRNEAVNQRIRSWINQSTIQSITQPNSHSINQSTNQPINQSISQSINESMNQGKPQRIKEPTKQWTNESTNEWSSGSMSQWYSQAMNQWSNEAMNQWSNEAMNQWISEAMNQGSNEYTNQWINKSMKQWSHESMNL